MIHKVSPLDSVLALNNSNNMSSLCVFCVCVFCSFPAPHNVSSFFRACSYCQSMIRVSTYRKVLSMLSHSVCFLGKMVSGVFSNWLPFIREMEELEPRRKVVSEKRDGTWLLGRGKISRKKLGRCRNTSALVKDGKIHFPLAFVSQLFSSWETKLLSQKWLPSRERVLAGRPDAQLPPMPGALLHRFRAQAIVYLSFFFQTITATPCSLQLNVGLSKAMRQPQPLGPRRPGRGWGVSQLSTWADKCERTLFYFIFFTQIPW